MITAEILDCSIEANGNILVKAQYKIDGVEIQSNYPMFNGKYYYVTRFSFVNFPQMDDTQIKASILNQCTIHAENLIKKSFTNLENIKINDGLSSLIGSTTSVDSAKIIIGDEEWDVKMDGTKTVNPVIET